VKDDIVLQPPQHRLTELEPAEVAPAAAATIACHWHQITPNACLWVLDILPLQLLLPRLRQWHYQGT
jgi:hypothetical protein